MGRRCNPLQCDKSYDASEGSFLQAALPGIGRAPLVWWGMTYQQRPGDHGWLFTYLPGYHLTT